MSVDPKTKPQYDDDDLEGDVHEEMPYEIERVTHTRKWGGIHMNAPEWANSPDSARGQRQERNQFWSRML